MAMPGVGAHHVLLDPALRPLELVTVSCHAVPVGHVIKLCQVGRVRRDVGVGTGKPPSHHLQVSVGVARHVLAAVQLDRSYGTLDLDSTRFLLRQDDQGEVIGQSLGIPLGMADDVDALLVAEVHSNHVFLVGEVVPAKVGPLQRVEGAGLLLGEAVSGREDDGSGDEGAGAVVGVVAASYGNEVGVPTIVVAIPSPAVVVILVAATAPAAAAPAVAGPGRARGAPFGGTPAIVVAFFWLLDVCSGIMHMQERLEN